MNIDLLQYWPLLPVNAPSNGLTLR
jgi:hypothetical protein